MTGLNGDRSLLFCGRVVLRRGRGSDRSVFPSMYIAAGGGSLGSTASTNPPSQYGHTTVFSEGNRMKRVHL
ncbi:hypothetical protein HanRHA438_Chr11g0504901 [Helianthus annuus]|nr:hypothetical protein HanRHA438_Chr11g0504901 [Helianthus annuus]